MFNCFVAYIGSFFTESESERKFKKKKFESFLWDHAKDDEILYFSV